MNYNDSPPSLKARAAHLALALSSAAAVLTLGVSAVTAMPASAAGLASVPSPEAGGAARRHLQEAPASADAGAGATEALVRRLVAEELGGLRQQVRALEEEVQALRRQLQPSPPPPR